MSTVKKSQARMDGAWVLRNSVQSGSVRIGEGSMLCRRRMAQTLDGARGDPFWPAHPGSCDSPKWGSAVPSEGPSLRCQRRCQAALVGGAVSSDDGPDDGVSAAECRAARRAFPDVNLVAEHDDLDRQFFVVMPDQAEQFDDSDEGEVERGQGHGPVSSPRPTPRKSCSGYPDGAFGTHRLLTKFRRSPRDQSEDLIHRSWLFFVGEPGDPVALSSR